MKNRFIHIALFLILLIPICVNAQMNSLVSQQYTNQFGLNPALAGMKEELSMNLHYRNQWRVIPGSPVISSVTADYGFGNRVGAGVKFYTDKAGLIARNAVSASYAYHLPLNDNNKVMHFGLSIGVMKDRLDSEAIIGDENDQYGDLFNLRKIYLDGDFGIAYTDERLTVQGALPNIKTYLKKDRTNSIQSSTMYLAMSYKLGNVVDAMTLEPKISYQGANGVDNFWNIGANLHLWEELVSFTGMYHSVRSSSFGMGVKYQRYLIQGFYSNHMMSQRESTGGSFELHLQMSMKKPAKKL